LLCLRPLSIPSIHDTQQTAENKDTSRTCLRSWTHKCTAQDIEGVESGEGSKKKGDVGEEACEEKK
jgi:hypothetical protein